MQSIYPSFWKRFDHKKVPTVLGIYLGFTKRKVESISPQFPNPVEPMVTIDWCIITFHIPHRVKRKLAKLGRGISHEEEGEKRHHAFKVRGMYRVLFRLYQELKAGIW